MYKYTVGQYLRMGKIFTPSCFETKIFVSSVIKLPKITGFYRMDPFYIGLFEFSLKVITDYNLIFEISKNFTF